MSVVVKRVTGRTLREFAQAGIFDPLEMRHTRIHDDHTKIEPGRATGYQPHEGGGFQIDMSDFEQTGDGSVFTNVEDLQRWDENFYHPKVGDQALLDTLQTRGVLTSGQTIDYALGLVIDQHRGLRRVGHGASGRDLRFTFEGPGPKGARRLTETVWGGKPVTFDAITPSGLSAARLAEYAGTYRSDELQVSYDLVTDNGRLVLRAHNLPKTELTATVNDVFASDSLTLKFERDARKRVAAFALGAGRIRNIRFVRVPSPETR